MAMEEVIKITASTTDAQKDIQKLNNVLNTVFGQNFAFKGVSTGKDGIAKITYALNGTNYQAEKLVGNMDKVIKKASKYKSITGISGNLKRTGRVIGVPEIPMPTLPGVYPSQVATGAHRSYPPAAPGKTFGMPEGLDNFLNSNYATADMGEKERENKRTNKILSSVNGGSSGGDVNAAMARALGGIPVDTKAAFKSAGIDSIASGDKNFKPAQLDPATGGLGKFNLSMKNAIKSVFMLQMASLGVAFSFMGIENSIIGLFNGLKDLGGVISGGAVGSAFAQLTGNQGTDIAATMGVTPEQTIAAWAGVTAIAAQFKAIIDTLAVKIMSPEMVAAILTVVDALAVQLGKPEVAAAIQEIVFAVLDIALTVIPLLPILASFIVFLGDTGLLKVLVAIIFAAQILLPTLAYVEFIMTAISTVGVILAAVFGVVSVSLSTVIIVVVAVAFVLDVIIRTFQNLANGMNPLDAIVKAFVDSLGDVWNIIRTIINGVTGILGFGNIIGGGSEREPYAQVKTVTINNNYNKNVGAADRKTAQSYASQINNVQMG